MKKITMYTGPLCNYCEAAKRLLARNNAPYNEIDISKVEGAMDEMIKKANGKRTIPQIFFSNIKDLWKKKGYTPVTKVKNPEPSVDDPDWIIWAAWADRITFEEIEEKTGKRESDVIKIMRRSLKPSSFRLWRKRVNQKSIKHRKKFEYSRKEITSKIKKGEYL